MFCLLGCVHLDVLCTLLIVFSCELFVVVSYFTSGCDHKLLYVIV